MVEKTKDLTPKTTKSSVCQNLLILSKENFAKNIGYKSFEELNSITKAGLKLEINMISNFIW